MSDWKWRVFFEKIRREYRKKNHCHISFYCLFPRQSATAISAHDALYSKNRKKEKEEIKKKTGMDHEKDGGVPLHGHFGRSLSNLFTRCATPGQVIVLSIDDITNGLGDEVEYLLDGNKRGRTRMMTFLRERIRKTKTSYFYLKVKRKTRDKQILFWYSNCCGFFLLFFGSSGDCVPPVWQVKLLGVLLLLRYARTFLYNVLK